MYAIVETGGKQYRVSQGDTFRVEKLPFDRGETVELDRVLMIAGTEDAPTIGTPMVDGAKVVCTVMEQGRAKKVIAFRYKAKKNVRVKRGHRQYFTGLKVNSIEVHGEDIEAQGEAVEAQGEAVEAQGETIETPNEAAEAQGEVE